MPLQFNGGEDAERARRAFGIRGRIPFQLDETVIPVVQLHNVDAPPYRQAGRRFRVHQFTDPVNFGECFLINTSPDFAAVIDQIIVNNSDTLLHEFLAGPVQTTLATFPPANQQPFTSESKLVRGALGVIELIQLRAGSRNTAALSAPAADVRFSLAANATLQLTGLEIVLPPVQDPSVISAYVVQGLTASARFSTSFFGRWFDDQLDLGRES